MPTATRHGPRPRSPRAFPDSTDRGPHYGPDARARAADAVAARGDLADLAAEAAQPGIVRATALWLLEQADDAAARGASRAAPVRSRPAGARRRRRAMQRAAPRARPRAAACRASRRSRAVGADRGGASAARRARRPAAPAAIAADFGRAWPTGRRRSASRLDFPETHLSARRHRADDAQPARGGGAPSARSCAQTPSGRRPGSCSCASRPRPRDPSGRWRS